MTTWILTPWEIEKAQLLTLDEAAKIEAEATQFATDSLAENLEESRLIYGDEHSRLIDLLVGEKVAHAQAKKIWEILQIGLDSCEVKKSDGIIYYQFYIPKDVWEEAFKEVRE